MRNYTYYYCVSWNFSSSSSKKKNNNKYQVCTCGNIYSRTSTIPSNPSNKGSPSYFMCTISTRSHIKSGWSRYGTYRLTLRARFPTRSDLISDSFTYILSTAHISVIPFYMLTYEGHYVLVKEADHRFCFVTRQLFNLLKPSGYFTYHQV